MACIDYSTQYSEIAICPPRPAAGNGKPAALCSNIATRYFINATCYAKTATDYAMITTHYSKVATHHLKIATRYFVITTDYIRVATLVASIM